MITKIDHLKISARKKLATLKIKFRSIPMNPTNLIVFSVALVLFVLLALNFQAIYSNIIIAQETKRLRNAARNEPDKFQNPQHQVDDFSQDIPSDFWNGIIANANGEVGSGTSFGVIEIFQESGNLVMQHVNDPDFEKKSSTWAIPASEKYNNVTLVSKRPFLPTDSQDVVVRFTMRVSQDYYGSAGVVMQPVGLLDADGVFHGPFNLFGLMFIGPESSLQGQSGAVCTISLNWVPLLTKALNVNIYATNQYEMRMSRLPDRDWRVSIAVNGETLCSETMPSLGPVVAHIWSDNYQFLTPVKQWYHLLAPPPGVEFQNEGHKKVFFGPIEINTEPDKD